MLTLVAFFCKFNHCWLQILGQMVHMESLWIEPHQDILHHSMSRCQNFELYSCLTHLVLTLYASCWCACLTCLLIPRVSTLFFLVVWPTGMITHKIHTHCYTIRAVETRGLRWGYGRDYDETLNYNITGEVDIHGFGFIFMIKLVVSFPLYQIPCICVILFLGILYTLSVALGCPYGCTIVLLISHQSIQITESFE